MFPFEFAVYDDTQKFSFICLRNFFSINFKILCMCSHRSWWINAWKYHIMCFFTFSESLLTFNHSAMLFSSCLAVSYISSKSSPPVKRWVSSANKKWRGDLTNIRQIIYIYIRNNNKGRMLDLLHPLSSSCPTTPCSQDKGRTLDLLSWTRRSPFVN